MRMSACLLVFPLILAGCNSPPPGAETPTQYSPLVGNPDPSAAAWLPRQGDRLQIQFSGEIDLNMEAEVYELDAFDTDEQIIAALHDSGVKVICYLNAGAWEDWREDAAEYDSAILGNAYTGWPGERWLDIRQINALAPILNARIDLCALKGFDGVDFDNVDGWQNNTGFDLSAADQLAFNRWLADAAHRRGLAGGLKNDPAQIADLEGWFDFLVLESCYAQDWCDLATPFQESGKAVFAIEYTDIRPFCSAAAQSEISLLQKEREMNAWRGDCSLSP